VTVVDPSARIGYVEKDNPPGHHPVCTLLPLPSAYLSLPAFVYPLPYDGRLPLSPIGELSMPQALLLLRALSFEAYQRLRTGAQIVG
jgi:hypothetical protein